MGNPKKLDIPLEKLIAIASAINANTIANKNRLKEDKIPTDKFIKQFGINRKDFSLTIKDTKIKYNPSTFLYDIPKLLQGNNLVTNTDIKLLEEDKQKSNYKVTTKSEHQSNNIITTDDELKSNNKVTLLKEKDLTSNINSKNIPEELRKIMTLSSELEEVVGVVTAKRKFTTLRHILPKHRYIQRIFRIYRCFNYSKIYFNYIA